MLTIEQVNQLSRREFIDTFGGIYENSPWVAEAVEPVRPMESVEDLHQRMAGVVMTSGEENRRALIQAHPSLGEKKPMSEESTSEQESAGLTEMEEEQQEELRIWNERYQDKFGMPFIMAVRGKTTEDILQAVQIRMDHSQEEEERQAVREIHRIALLRLEAIIEEERTETMSESNENADIGSGAASGEQEASAALSAEPARMSQTVTRTSSKKRRTMSYGKGDVFAYRTFSIPFTDITPIPESPYEGTNNTIFGLNVSVNITGEAFLPSFTEGDNSMVVATDSMKNFIQRHLGSYEGATVEGFLAYVGEAFLEKYDHVETAEVYADHLPFEKVNVDNTGYKSGVVFKKSHNENPAAMVKVGRTSFGAPEIIEQESYVKDVQLVKVVDNSFVGFIRDEYTTLPEDSNRPLFIYLNIGWTYETPQTAFGQNGEGYVAAEQVKDIAAAVFHETQTASIQQLIYYIGRRVLERFPQLQEVSFESQNHTWDTVVEDIPGSDGKVYTEPRRPYGFQRFAVHREDLDHEGEI